MMTKTALMKNLPGVRSVKSIKDGLKMIQQELKQIHENLLRSKPKQPKR